MLESEQLSSIFLRFYPLDKDYQFKILLKS